MFIYNQSENQNTKTVVGDDLFNDTSAEELEFIKLILSKDFDILNDIENVEMSPPSRYHKIQMNRLFREHVGGSFLPYPEADNLYEQMRSGLVIKLSKLKNYFNQQKHK